MSNANRNHDGDGTVTIVSPIGIGSL